MPGGERTGRSGRPGRAPHYRDRVVLIGWGDESGSDESRDPGSYLLSVVLAEQQDAARIAEAMLALVFKGTPKLHWRDEIPRRRLQIVQALAELPAAALVVVRSRPDVAERPERRRRKCLERLLPLLAARGCSELILESRGAKDDARDRYLLDTLRRAHRLPHGLHLDHTPGPQDPALWAADALCGVIVCDRVQDPREHDYLAILSAGILVEVIDT